VGVRDGAVKSANNLADAHPIRRSPDGFFMYQPPPSSTARAFRRMHAAVVTCCWVFGLCVAAQIVVWAMISFTTVRTEPLTADAPEKAVVSSEEVRPMSVADALRDSPAPMASLPPQPARTLSVWDGRLHQVQTLASGVGIVSGLVLTPIVALGLVLSVSLSVVRCDRAAMGFFAAMFISVSVLPLRHLLGHVEFEGLLLPYAMLSTMADAYEHGAQGTIVYFARHLATPVAAIFAALACAIWFRNGVESGMFSRELAELDAAIDREASNVRATSLRGAGRAATALGRVSPDSDDLPSATAVSPGAAPRRLI
jgi:hypothetical protein